jgi:hypothetical protein
MEIEVAVQSRAVMFARSDDDRDFCPLHNVRVLRV